jgi:H+/Cl- antiporter ClcA
MIKKQVKINFLFLCVGILSGLGATVFLTVLQLLTEYRQSHTHIVWYLPIAGLFIGYFYKKLSHGQKLGNALILSQIKAPLNRLPLKMAPMVLIGTWMTHLFGGSAGREGTAIQISASLSDQLGRFVALTSDERRGLLTAAVGSGFSAAIGAPFAGAIFGAEVAREGRMRLKDIFQGLLASYVGYYFSVFLGCPHTQFGKVLLPDLSLKLILLVFVASLFFGLFARGFIYLKSAYSWFMLKFVREEALRPFFGGVILVVLFMFEGTGRFQGLGLEEIILAFKESSDFYAPILKSFFTVITVASGFKGGEFIPLVFIGSTLGSAMSVFLPSAITLLSAIGFSSVFGAASKAPFACAIMTGELFGFQVAPYAIFAGYLAYLVSGKDSIYSH